MHVVLFVECCLRRPYTINILSPPFLFHFYAFRFPFHFRTSHGFSYSGAGEGALTAIGTAPSTVSGSGDSVRSSATCGRGKGSSDSGGRTPPRRRRGVARELLRASVGGGGGSERSALLGSQERNVR